MTSKPPLLLAAAIALAVLVSVPGAYAQPGAEAPVLSATSTGAVGIRESVSDLAARQAQKDLTHPRIIRNAEKKSEGKQKRDRRDLPLNPESPHFAATGEGLRAVAPLSRITQPLAPQTIGTSFTAATLSGTNPTLSFPPDNMGAVGPTQFVTFVNGRLVTFNKTTGVADAVLNVDPDVFFASVVNGSSTSDPRVRYDRLTGRWFLLIINVSTPNRILIAVSDAASAGVISGSTTFTYFFINIATTPPAIANTCFADYPTLGIDANALYVGTNNFCGSPSQTYNSTDGYVIRKTSILGAGPIVLTTFRGLVANSGAAGPYTPQGVDNLDASATEGYFIGVDNQAYGLLQMRRVTNPGGTPAISANIPITVSATAAPINVEHQGNTGGANGRLSSLDDRLFAATIRGGKLWTAHNIGVNNTGVSSGTSTRNGSRWYELNVPVGGTPTVVQSGTVFTASASNVTTERSYWVPSVMISGQGHAAMALCAAGTNDRANAATVGRLAGDAAGTMQAPTLITASSTAYNPPSDPGGAGIGRRWGDYTYTSVDPLDDMTMWTVSQFTNATNSYGVRVTKLIAPPPATPSVLADITAGQATVNVTLTGAVVSGSGFFDPGANLPGVPAFNHLSAAITNGSATGTPPTVVSATYVNPTTVNLVLNASSATANVGAEKYTLTITNPDGQATSAAVVHVVGGTPVASINSVSATETNSGTTTFAFTVSLSQTSASPVSVNFATSDGTATTADGDYVGASGTLNIPANQPSGTINVTVNGDTKHEADETFTVTLSSPVGVTLGTGTGTGTITNDDAVPSVTVSGVTVAEGNAGATTASFTVSLSQASGLAASVGYATADGSATEADGDYTAAAGTVNFAPGATSVTVDVNVTGDTKHEADEAFSLILSSPTGAGLGVQSFADGTITNDDAAPTLVLSGFVTAEGDAGSHTANCVLTLSAASGLPVSVDFATDDSTATIANGDYASGGGTATFTPGETSKNLGVLVYGDVTFEPTELLLVRLSNATGALIQTPSAACGILNDDSGPIVTVGAGSITEGDAGTVVMQFPVTLSNGSSLPVSFDWVTADGTANGGTDYVAATGTLTVAAKTLSDTIEVTVNGDLCDEAHETFTLQLSNEAGGTLASTSATGTIENDDNTVAPTVAVTSPNGGETLTTGTSATLTWTATDDVAVANVKIELSRDGGATFSEVIAASAPNTGSYNWTVTSPAVATATVRVTAEDVNCHTSADTSDAVFAIQDPTTGVPGGPVTAFALGAIVPNPTRGAIQFEYALPRDARVRVSVLDVQGREVAVLASGVENAGRHSVQWAGARAGAAVPRGLYFVRFEAGGKVLSRRFTIIR
ncbi:MAG: T9SS type A sorting domain-containing protein [Candidatus Eisenbacteria bacterium]|nr:T9SS type A sorting domain-containing protein [Candidatus Eisenbacteria bacterium]